MGGVGPGAEARPGTGVRLGARPGRRQWPRGQGPRAVTWAGIRGRGRSRCRGRVKGRPRAGLGAKDISLVEYIRAEASFICFVFLSRLRAGTRVSS